MAVDTAVKRLAVAGTWGESFTLAPLPDGEIDAGDRALLAGLYPYEMEASEEDGRPFSLFGWLHPFSLDGAG